MRNMFFKCTLIHKSIKRGTLDAVKHFNILFRIYMLLLIKDKGMFKYVSKCNIVLRNIYIFNISAPNESFGGRGLKKKKAAMLLPIVMLFKLFKIKVIVALTLAAVIFIKKVILLFALFAPSYLQMLKICKVPHHGGHSYVEDVHHDVGSSGFGYASHGGYSGGGYGKDWGNSRAYAAYKPT